MYIKPETSLNCPENFNLIYFVLDRFSLGKICRELKHNYAGFA